MFVRLPLVVVAAFSLLVSVVSAQPLRVAVAANFAAPAEAVADAFTAETGVAVTLSSGSTGALFAQITQGAPFTVFLAADARRPEELENQGFAVHNSRFTYALGKLVLFSTDAGLVDGEGKILSSNDYAHLAVANAASAPYGAAALEVIEALGLTGHVADRLVTGDSIAQTFAFVESGNAELGFVALSQISGRSDGSRWVVSAELYQPIRQDAVLLEAGNDDAEAFMAFLKSAKAREIIAEFGYDLEETEPPSPSIYG